MAKQLKTKVLTEVALLLAVGFVLKLVTDIVTRTVFSFLFIDLLMLVTVVILYRHPHWKIAFSVAVIEGAVSALLFPTTDIWFVRPIVVLIAFGLVKWVQKRKWKETTRFMMVCFFTSKFTILTVSFILIGFVFLNPEYMNFDIVIKQLESFSDMGMISQEEMNLFYENMEVIISIALLLLGVVYAYIPAFVHMFLGWMVSKALKLNNIKKEQ